MGFLDRLTGTRHPDTGVAPRSAAEVRAALLAVNGPGVPYRVRNALPQERADLVAEWRVPERRLTLTTRMRLVPARHEVRAVDEQWEARPREDSRTYVRGQVTAVSREWKFERGADGRLRLNEVFRFDPSEMKEPLRGAVLRAGWTWRGVLFGL
ncbi:hypothetical protein BLA24_17450 [Streptomyces cinnamoneus]|uniref:Uncharacterized protein n=1 Tax=Streptomyces cinnamoneus TaxID=53446 RepID=A0A2G1XHC2_STRCJ|nr:hypothetical protein [Streptomyces cinnamoneus]PHQ50591.1 hypothetical protein BLA24_17450 [Streptomyces cinnamoneus]PPT14154.1 hypothetical protein CYQ11_15825 [Streptomyces cinnamoneus]